jgi:hypothetical protein
MFQIDDSELDQLINNVDSLIRDDTEIIEDLKTQLYVDGHLLSFLKMNIGNVVYGQTTDDPNSVATDPNSSDPSPNVMYHRTGDLMKSARLSITDRGFVLYMDDDWLSKQPQANLEGWEQIQQGYSWIDEYGETLPSFGEASDAHNGESYAERVHEGHTYNNQYMQGNKEVETTRSIPSRPYMEVTFNKLPQILDRMDKRELINTLIARLARGG